MSSWKPNWSVLSGLVWLKGCSAAASAKLMMLRSDWLETFLWGSQRTCLHTPCSQPRMCASAVAAWVTSEHTFTVSSHRYFHLLYIHGPIWAIFRGGGRAVSVIDHIPYTGSATLRRLQNSQAGSAHSIFTRLFLFITPPIISTVYLWLPNKWLLSVWTIFPIFLIDFERGFVRNRFCLLILLSMLDWKINWRKIRNRK